MNNLTQTPVATILTKCSNELSLSWVSRDFIKLHKNDGDWIIYWIWFVNMGLFSQCKYRKEPKITSYSSWNGPNGRIDPESLSHALITALGNHKWSCAGNRKKLRSCTKIVFVYLWMRDLVQCSETTHGHLRERFCEYIFGQKFKMT